MLPEASIRWIALKELSFLVQSATKQELEQQVVRHNILLNMTADAFPAMHSGSAPTRCVVTFALLLHIRSAWFGSLRCPQP